MMRSFVHLAALPLFLWTSHLALAQTTVSVPVSDDVTVLSPFVLSERATDGTRITESTSGTLVARPLDQLPMSISVVGSEQLKQLNILNADALTLVVPGLADQNSGSTAGDSNNTQFTSRGFTVLPHLNGFAPGGRLFDMTNIDRVEVVRGPNSMLYGQSDPGGVINFVTKRPTLRVHGGVHGDVSVAAGNLDYYRTEIDADATLLPGKLGFRLPASYTDGSREIQYFRNRVTSINPSVLWRILPNTEVAFEYDYLHYQTNPAPLRPFIWTPPGSSHPIVDVNNQGLGSSYNPYGPYARSTTTQKNWFFELTSRLTDHITLHGVYSDNVRDDNDATLNIPGGGIFSLTGPVVNYRGLDAIDGNHIRGYKLDLLGKWNIGKVTTRTIVGYEYNRNVYHLTGNYVTWANGGSNYFTSINVGYDPATGLATRTPAASDFVPFPTPIPGPKWNLVYGPLTAESKWTNERVSEVLSAFDDRLQLLGGVARGKSTLVNVSNGSTQSSSATVYQAGLGVAVDSRKEHLVFVNQSTSYQPDFLLDINGNPLPATTAKGLEGGIKSTWGDTGLVTTFTVFTQKRADVGRQYADPSLGRSYGILTPGEESKGVELEAWYRINRQLDVSLIYSQFHGEIIGVQPGQEYLLGRELPRAPERTGNLIITYRPEWSGAWSHLNLTAGAKYASDTWLDTSEGKTTLGWQRSNAYTVVFLALAKEFKLDAGRALTVRLNIGNLFDHRYINEGLAYGEPRTIRLAVDFKF